MSIAICKGALLVASLALLGTLTGAQAAYGTAELTGPALAQAVSVQLAQGELTQARAEVTRLASDPLALRPARMAAQARADEAAANLRLSELQVRAALAAELAALSAAEYGLRLAKVQAEMAQIGRSAAQVRFDAGAATALDLETARAEANNAAAAVAQAETALKAAQDAVERRTGQLPRQGLKLSDPPSLSALNMALQHHPRMIKARAALAQAELDLTVKSTDLSAAVEVQAAQAAVLAARSAVADTQLSLESALTAAWQEYQTVVSAVAPAARTASTAAEQAHVQQQRFGSGLISKQVLLKSQLDALQAESELDRRRAAAESALAALSVAANTKAWN
ncbi:hypothetical protein GCM10017783_25340 [Deinococcus piscis]|uniref:Outer membrane efflux protein n=1 Tax=Deinococcus piscis TaxID=394230 RepID=A0ABQ3KED2_9DEIO|nr:TolC family protein [Deinococcus piscis]GHG12086.1 hypothetical protein GCM10017783_25340 [Deinococcus piscis]